MFSEECGGTVPAWDEVSASVPVSTSIPEEVVNGAEAADPCWILLPSMSWFGDPIGHRAMLGHELVDKAVARLDSIAARSGVQSLIDPPNLWCSPFNVAFISVGFR